MASSSIAVIRSAANHSLVPYWAACSVAAARSSHTHGQGSSAVERRMRLVPAYQTAISNLLYEKDQSTCCSIRLRHLIPSKWGVYVLPHPCPLSSHTLVMVFSHSTCP